MRERYARAAFCLLTSCCSADVYGVKKPFGNPYGRGGAGGRRRMTGGPPSGRVDMGGSAEALHITLAPLTVISSGGGGASWTWTYAYTATR